ncbi:MAG: inorganic phosphate transporter [Chloroflexi bacterium]|nr:inorganic phosphate transporter [Chloroflexota bacterium]
MINEFSLAFLIVVIVVAVVFDFANGFNDAANAIATVVSTRVMSPLAAVLMAAAMNFVGALAGTAVAKAVAKGVVNPEDITLLTVAGGVAAAATWVFVATRFGMPVSGSHSLIAGVAGAGLAHGGFDALAGAGIIRIVQGLIFSPIMGFLGGYILMLSIYWGLRRVAPALISAAFGKLQILTAAAMAFSHGSNDAQKTMGIIALALAVSPAYTAMDASNISVPLWVIILSGTVMAAGTYLGGSRVIHTLGVRIVAMRPVHGFAAEASAASVITFASRIGLPISTTHVITSSILGMGSTRRLSAVRWGVAQGIVYAWILTFPICGLLGAGIYGLLRLAS